MIADMKKVTVYHNGHIFGRMRLCHICAFSSRPALSAPCTGRFGFNRTSSASPYRENSCAAGGNLCVGKNRV